MTIFTIGFAKKSAKTFFEDLRASGAKRLLDVRLHNTSQLAGFTKRDDLRYFLKAIVGMDYERVELLAPQEQFLKEYRKTRDWATFERRYCDTLWQRHVAENIRSGLFDRDVVLLCSEPEPDRCHRRLAAEFIANVIFPGSQVRHL